MVAAHVSQACHGEKRLRSGPTVQAINTVPPAPRTLPATGVGMLKIALLLLVAIAGYTQGSWERMTPFINYAYDADSECSKQGARR